MKATIYDIEQSSLNEIHQATPMLFALARMRRDGLHNIMPLVKCRDYFNELCWVQHTRYKLPVKVHGFSWKFDSALARQFAFNKRMHLIVATKDRELEKKLQLIRSMDNYMGFLPTKIKEFEDVHFPDGEIYGWYNEAKIHYHVHFDTRWMSNSVLMSLYTLILRAAVASFSSGYTDFMAIMEDIRNGNLDVCHEDIGLLKVVYKHREYFTEFFKNWEKYTGPGGQGSMEPSGEEGYACTLYGKIHNGSGVGSLGHVFSFVANDPDCDGEGNLLYDWGRKVHKKVCKNIFTAPTIKEINAPPQDWPLFFDVK